MSTCMNALPKVELSTKTISSFTVLSCLWTAHAMCHIVRVAAVQVRKWGWECWWVASLACKLIGQRYTKACWFLGGVSCCYDSWQYCTLQAVIAESVILVSDLIYWSTLQGSSQDLLCVHAPQALDVHIPRHTCNIPTHSCVMYTHMHTQAPLHHCCTSPKQVSASCSVWTMRCAWFPRSTVISPLTVSCRWDGL